MDLAALYESLASRLLNLPRPQQVVDLRCRTGGLSLRLADLFPKARILGLDTSSDQVRLATSAAAEAGLGGRITFEHIHGAALPLANHSVDLITGAGALVASSSPAGLFREMDRVLKRGGHAVLGEWIRERPEGEGLTPLPLLQSREAARPSEEQIRCWLAGSPFKGHTTVQAGDAAGGAAFVMLTLHLPVDLAPPPGPPPHLQGPG